MFDAEKYSRKTPVSILFNEYYKVAGRIFGDYFARSRATDEDKKSLEAIDFMNGLMNGNIKKEWKLQDTDDYKLLGKLIDAINLLSDKKKEQ